MADPHLHSRSARASCFLFALLLIAWALPVLSFAQDSGKAAVASDARAGKSLQSRLSAVPGLQGVAVQVTGGVAQLQGEVLEAEQLKQAGEIAAATPGVASVENKIMLDTSLRPRFRAAYAQMTGKLVRLLAATPLLLIAVLIVVLASWLGGVISRRLHWLHLRTQNPYMDGLVRRVVRSLVVLVGVVIALDLLGAASLIGAVLGSAGVVGLVLGFAFKDVAENYIAGILLSLRRPFAPGDHVVIDNREGKVIALSSRVTILMTLDGNHLQLPNGMVFKSVLLNYSRNPNRRFDFSVTIDPAQSIRESQTLALAGIREVEGVLEDPPPSWMVVEYAPTGIELRFFGWVDQTSSDLGKVRSEAIRVTKAAYADAGIEGPRTVHHIVLSRADARQEKATTPAVEPAHAADADTSVNRDIDAQLAMAQSANTSPNLLRGGGEDE